MNGAQRDPFAVAAHMHVVNEFQNAQHVRIKRTVHFGMPPQIPRLTSLCPKCLQN